MIIDEDCYLRYAVIQVFGNNGCIHIGKNSKINGTKTSKTRLCCGGSTIDLGSDCLLSNGIGIYSTDFHCIFSSKNGEIINKNEDICIKNHVWIGLRSQILKGCMVESGSIIGAGSLVTGKFREENIIIAGNPARKINDNIFWVHDSVNP